MQERKHKKTWFITGASQGLGLALVKQLLVRGDQVAATTRCPGRLAEQIRQVIPTALAGNFLPLQVDLTNETAIGQALADTHARFGRIDVVVNNAGYALKGAVETLDPADIHQCFAINTTATMTVMHKAMPYMRQQQAGYILNISSFSSCAAATNIDLYAATKYAVLGLSDTMAAEARKSGIAITVILPTAFQPRLSSREYDALGECDLLHTAIGLIHLAEQPAPPPILLTGENTDLQTIKKQILNVPLLEAHGIGKTWSVKQN